MAGRTKDKDGHVTSQLLNFTPDSYLERTSRPIYAIVFLLPFIVFYEVGTILINTDVLNHYQVRVVAFVWLQDLLQHFGTGTRFAWVAPPLVVVLILLGFQLASRKPWYFCLSDYTPMLVECILLALPLIALSLMLNGPASDTLWQTGPVEQGVRTGMAEGRRMLASEGAAYLERSASPATEPTSPMTDIVTGVGAGIYEELVFRLILICALMVLFQDLIGMNHKNAIVLAVLVSAALFSAHHHIGWHDGQLGRIAPFAWPEFAFRTAAGVYFAGLFALRGFGITAGTHAFYDIIATVVNAIFFAR